MKQILLKTSPHNCRDIKTMIVMLDNHPRISAWNIDLDDCDKILRIECEALKVEEIIDSLYQTGIWSEELQD